MDSWATKLAQHPFHHQGWAVSPSSMKTNQGMALSAMVTPTHQPQCCHLSNGRKAPSTVGGTACSQMLVNSCGPNTFLIQSGFSTLPLPYANSETEGDHGTAWDVAGQAQAPPRGLCYRPLSLGSGYLCPGSPQLHSAHIFSFLKPSSCSLVLVLAATRHKAQHHHCLPTRKTRSGLPGT